MPSDRLTRRRFLETTAASGTLAAGSRFILPAAAPAQAEAGSSEGKPIRFGMIGVGMRGSDLLAHAIRLPGVSCGGVSELYDGRMQLAREILAGVAPPAAVAALPQTRDYRQLLARPDLDCIIAAVPDHWHKQIILDTLAAGKDIYCEKPMTHLPEEGAAILAACRRTGRFVQVGSQEPSSVLYQKARELVAQGAIGPVSLVESSLGRDNACGAWRYGIPPDLSPQTLDWNAWLGSAPQRPFSPQRFARWRCWNDYGEGVSGDLFIHSLTGIHYVLGVTAPPLRAYSTGGLFRWKDGRDAPDVLTTIYEYPNFRVTLRVTLVTGQPEVYRFMGSGGTLEMRGIENPDSFTVYPQDGLDHSPCDPAWPRAMAEKFDRLWYQKHATPPGAARPIASQTWSVPPGYDDTRDHLWNYFQSVRTRRQPVENAEFGQNAAIACHMANYSYFHQAPAIWDAAAGRIRL